MGCQRKPAFAGGSAAERWRGSADRRTIGRDGPGGHERGKVRVEVDLESGTARSTGDDAPTCLRSSITLALGSNRGDRAENLARACARIAEAGVSLERASSLYETAAIDAPGATVDPAGDEAGRDFLNQVVVARTELAPEELLGLFQRIEESLGRDRTAPRNAARVIDIDILAMGDRRVSLPDLSIPHAACLDRHFVLVPWAEVDPDAIIPGSGGTVAEALARLDARTALGARPRVERVDPAEARSAEEER